MNKAETASAKMKARTMNCAQSVLSTYAGDHGLDPKTATKLASGFGGGMHQKNICGAITGCYMVLGLINTIDPENPRGSLDIVFSRMKELNRQFNAMHGSIFCHKLICFDMGNPAEVEAAREKGIFTTLCPKYVHDAVTILESIIK
jgi:C_GCAxxG_C_C family probable redox protein